MKKVARRSGRPEFSTLQLTDTLVLVVLVDRLRVVVMGVVVIVIMGVTVRQIPMLVFMLMFDHGACCFAAQTSASFAHMSLLGPDRPVSDFL